MKPYEPPLEILQAYVDGLDTGLGLEDQCRSAINNALKMAQVIGQDIGEVLQYYLSQESTQIGIGYIINEVSMMGLLNQPLIYSCVGVGIAHAIRNFSLESDREKMFGLIDKYGWQADPNVREELGLTINYLVRQRLNLWNQDKALLKAADRYGALPTE